MEHPSLTAAPGAPARGRHGPRGLPEGGMLAAQRRPRGGRESRGASLGPLLAKWRPSRGQNSFWKKIRIIENPAIQRLTTNFLPFSFWKPSSIGKVMVKKSWCLSHRGHEPRIYWKEFLTPKERPEESSSREGWAARRKGWHWRVRRQDTESDWKHLLASMLAVFYLYDIHSRHLFFDQ